MTCVQSLLAATCEQRLLREKALVLDFKLRRRLRLQSV